MIGGNTSKLSLDQWIFIQDGMIGIPDREDWFGSSSELVQLTVGSFALFLKFKQVQKLNEKSIFACAYEYFWQAKFF